MDPDAAARPQASLEAARVHIHHPSPAPSTSANPFASLVASQTVAVVESFALECGRVLRDVEVGYRTWGKLDERRANVLLICHALTGSADVEDWWGPLMGVGRAFDPSRYFIFCANVLGSPYGSSSPVTIDPDTGERYGPEFPATTIRDDVRLHKVVLDHLGVESVAVAIGGSMGGMAVLEWALCSPEGYVRNVIPIATSGRHSAWGISWGEAQRQSIYSDPVYADGYYSYAEPPSSGLAAARMAALLTYRSRDSFEDRFGRKEQPRRTAWDPPRTAGETAAAHHNDGHARVGKDRPDSPASPRKNGVLTPSIVERVPDMEPPPSAAPLIFSAQSYLRYQGHKFVSRFDANCYIAITRKMDSHDLARGRTAWPGPLASMPPHALIIAISSDGLFTISEQRELATWMPEAHLEIIDSPEGHDGFLLEFEQIDRLVVAHLHERLPEMYSGPPVLEVPSHGKNGFEVTKTSVFGEAEANDLTRW